MRKALVACIVFTVISYCHGLAQGTNCSNAMTIPLNGTCSNYNVSSTNGSTLLCNGQGYGGNGRVTYFRFTTNSTPECVSLDIEASVAGTTIEAVLFTTCKIGRASCRER